MCISATHLGINGPVSFYKTASVTPQCKYCQRSRPEPDACRVKFWMNAPEKEQKHLRLVTMTLWHCVISSALLNQPYNRTCNTRSLLCISLCICMRFCVWGGWKAHPFVWAKQEEVNVLTDNAQRRSFTVNIQTEGSKTHQFLPGTFTIFPQWDIKTYSNSNTHLQNFKITTSFTRNASILLNAYKKSYIGYIFLYLYILLFIYQA